jgi:hypothetical protein
VIAEPEFWAGNCFRLSEQCKVWWVGRES